MRPARSNPLVLALLAVVVLPGCSVRDDVATTDLPALNTARDKRAPRGQAGAEADWLSRPTSVRAAAGLAEAGVIGTVESVSREASVVAAPDESNPTSIVTMRVRDPWFGDVPDRFEIKWLGTPGGGYLEGDPPYEVGQDYVLFLKRRTDGPWYRPASPDGRMQILGDQGRPVIDGPLYDEVKGESPGQIKRTATQAR